MAQHQLIGNSQPHAHSVLASVAEPTQRTILFSSMASTGKKRTADEVGASAGSESKRERRCEVELNLNRQAALDAYKDELEKAEEMVPVLGKLYRDHNVVTMYFGQALCNLAPARIIRLHQSCAVGPLVTTRNS